MIIEELKGGEVEGGEEKKSCLAIVDKNNFKGDVAREAKRLLVGAGARALFYPTLIYNVVRNKFEAEFRWWDRVDQFILLGAVPFPTDVPRLKVQGVGGVVTLNEPYETLVSTSLYQAYDIDHLVIPTRDYCFAPSLTDISLAVDFIQRNALQGQSTYVHCKAGRGRSTTVVICYLVQHRQMTPGAAYAYVRSIRPRVLLASAQWLAVHEYYKLKVRGWAGIERSDLVIRYPRAACNRNLVPFDDGSVVVVTEADLNGYDPNLGLSATGNAIWADLSVVYRVRAAGQAALERISCLWFRCQTSQKMLAKQLSTNSSCTMEANRLGGICIDFHVY